MPGMDGLAVARRLREKGVTTPILLLTARDAVSTALPGWRRAPTTTWSSRSPMRSWWPGCGRCCGGDPAQRRLAYADLVFDLESRRATRGGVEIDLTPREAGLLELLLRRPGKVVSRRPRWTRCGATAPL